MKLTNSYELLKALKKIGFIKDNRDKYWWPNSGTFEVLIGAILTQQTKWQKVEKSLNNLREKDLLTIDNIANIDIKEFAILIKPSGFYNTKAKRLKQLCKNIKNKFNNYENFQQNVTREWLLEQKGIGFESADSILCFGCYRDIFVVDSYTNRLLQALGYEFEDYHQIQEWMIQGLEDNIERVYELYDKEIDRCTIFSRFHGKIVEYCKENIKGKNIKIERLIYG